MAQPERQTHFHIVTSSKPRAEAFEKLLGADRVRQIQPNFTEDIMRKPLNTQPTEWPMEMAETKAFQDIAALMVRSYLSGAIETGYIGDIPADDRVVRIYSDTINVVYSADPSEKGPFIIEKPKTIGSWLTDKKRGALSLSGNYTEICTALTAIDMTDPAVHPRTVLVRLSVKMKPFTQEDVKAFIDRHGEESIMRSSSGVSFVNDTVELFDTSKPLRIYLQTDPNTTPRLITELPSWEYLTKDDRLRILYGALPEAVQAVTTELPQARPHVQGRPTSARYTI